VGFFKRFAFGARNILEGQQLMWLSAAILPFLPAISEDKSYIIHVTVPNLPKAHRIWVTQATFVKS
jgi:hypothetical protein